MQELNIEAKVENLDKVIAFVGEEIDKLECSQKIRVQIDVRITLTDPM